MAFYLLLAFASVSPGFLYLFILKPDLIMSYDVTRLLLLCISLSGSGLLVFTWVVWICWVSHRQSISLRLFIMLGCMGSICGNFLALALEKGAYFSSAYFFWLGNIALIVAVVTGVGRHWSRRYFLNLGVLIFVMTTFIVVLANKPWVALSAKAS